MGINLCGRTDIGLKRTTNQDCFRTLELDGGLVLIVVCDGMGGAAGGSEASSLAADTFCKYAESHIKKNDKSEYLKILEEALASANVEVCARSKSDPSLEGMGTTLVCALYDGEDYYCLWVGDSRIYTITDSGILQLSHDHSFVQTLVDSGSITKDEAKKHPNRNIITKAVGTEDVILPDVSKTSADAMRGILLCSDGLCGYVPEDVIAGVCNENEDAEALTDELVRLANEAGGPDNITVVVHIKK